MQLLRPGGWYRRANVARGPARGSATEERHPALPRSTPTSILPQDTGEEVRKGSTRSMRLLSSLPKLFLGEGLGWGSIGWF